MQYAKGLPPKRPPTTDELQGQITKLQADVSTLSNTVKKLGVTMTKTRKQLQYAQTLTVAGTVGSGAVIEQLSPFTGYIKEVMINYPPGCVGLVDVAISHNLIPFCPTSGFLAMDNFSPLFSFNEAVKRDEPIRVEMRNRDGLNVHRITVTVTIEEA